ncbi:MAG TPA: CAP domain-containing protein [Oceanospirillales bacterium]|nr:CAP domain-containing protein [Oceanospirillales bacterium]
MKPINKIIIILFAIFNIAIAQIYTDYSPIAANTAVETALLNETNRVRQQNGLSQLQFDPKLALAARHHAEEMARLNYFSHQSPTPASKTPAMRVARAGSGVVAIGENLALVHPGNVASSSLEGWMNSPGHRENLLNPIYTHVGFGTATNKHGMEIVVQVFAVEPFEIVGSEVRESIEDNYELSIIVNVKQSAEYVLEIAGEFYEAGFLQAGTHELKYTTTEKALVAIQIGILNPAGNSYITQDSGWLNLTNNNFQVDEIASKQYLEILGVSARAQRSNINEIFLIVKNVGNNDLAAFINQSYLDNILSPQGYIHLRVANSLINPEISVGIINGSQVNLPYAFVLDNSHGKAFLRPKALN